MYLASDRVGVGWEGLVVVKVEVRVGGHFLTLFSMGVVWVFYYCSK